MRGIWVLVAALAALGVAVVAQARPGAKPKVKTLKLAVTYELDASYANTSNLGTAACGASGKETADIALRFTYKPVKLRLASGAQVFASGSEFPAGSEWTEQGTQDVAPTAEGILCPPDFNNPRPLHCSGRVGVLQDQTVRRRWWLIPLRDAVHFIVWLASFASNRVTWGDTQFVMKNGQMIPVRNS